ncbi:MAG: transporter [Cyanobacteriota bacterium]|nr:transporter [Cyanobacteriota bacterium]
MVISLMAAKARHLLALTAGLALGSWITTPAQGQMYGPRQFWPAPVGTDVFTLAGFYTRSNTIIDTSIVFPNLEIDTTVLAPSYTRFFDLGGRLLQATVAVPYAWADVAVNVDTKRRDLGLTPSRQGVADGYAHLTLGLLNAPALPAADFGGWLAKENPAMVIVALAGLFAPTGAYDANRVVNIGTNRWTFRAGLPMTARLGPSWAPGRVTTLEVLPSLDLFTSNSNPSKPEFNLQVRGLPIGQAISAALPAPSTTGQRPLGALELHLTHDLTPQLWVSLDSYSKAGGETTADGVGKHNRQLWTALGATVGGSPWRGARIGVTAGGVVAGNDDSPNGWLVRLQLQQSW